jgi:hypothetical protein
MFRFSRGSRFLALGLALGCSLGVLGAKLQEVGVFTVKKSVENFRTSPDGEKLGTLLEGTEIERISEQGKWVRFRVEGWIWGPSLEGFEEEKEESVAAKSELPRLPLQDNLPRIKRLINETYGVFYGVSLDKIARRLVLRFRVRNIDREGLQRRQMGVQYEVLEILEGKLEFEAVRIENNRPDGSGQVGTEIAETRVEDIRRYARGEIVDWQAHTRISADGGETWGDKAENIDEKTDDEEVFEPQEQIQEQTD